MTNTPRMFALTRGPDDIGRAGQIVGYGMVLPDGSTYSVSWPPHNGSAFFSASSAEQTADLRDADLVWLPHQP